MFLSREALSDVDMILNELKDPKNSRALAIRGDALYNLGNFEHSLLNYHRAKKNAKIKVRYSCTSYLKNIYVLLIVFEQTPKYQTLNTPNIECLNITFWPKIEH